MTDPAPKIMVTLVYHKHLHQFFLKCPGLPDCWMYLGKDIARSTHAAQIIGDRCQRMNIGEHLQRTAINCRQEYIDFVGRLGQRFSGDMRWWLTSLSERNPFVSDVFLHLCYVTLAVETARIARKDLLIVCESYELLQSLYKNLHVLPNVNTRVYGPGPGGRVNAFSKHLTWEILQKIWFVSRFGCRRLLARVSSARRKRLRTAKPGSMHAFIHSWTDARSFTDDDAYRDVYFGTLPRELKKRDVSICYLAEILPTVWFPRVLRRLMMAQENIVLLEDCITFTNILQAAMVHQQTLRNDDIPPFGNLDVSDLVNGEIVRDRLNTRSEQAYLCYCASRTIGKRYEPQVFIYAFENHIWEKMFCMGLNSFSPETKTVGYAHTIVNPMYTCYTCSEYEKEAMPLPDRIIVNGERPKKILAESGFDQEKLWISGSLRNPRLGFLQVDCREIRRPPSVLVAASASINESLELIHKIYAAFRDTDDISLLIKLHPTVTREMIDPDLPLLPEHIRITETPMDKLLSEVDLMIYMSTSASVEALARGLPVLHIKSDCSIDMDVFSSYDNIPSVSKPKEILAETRKLLVGGSMAYDEAQAILQELFAPVRENVVDVFLARET